jgi:hypothetical protein
MGGEWARCIIYPLRGTPKSVKIDSGLKLDITYETLVQSGYEVPFLRISECQPAARTRASRSRRHNRSPVPIEQPPNGGGDLLRS